MAVFFTIPVIIVLVFGVILGGISAFLVYMAVQKHKRVKLLTGTRMTSIASLRPGIAKTSGDVRALERPTVSPMTRTECVFFDFRVEEQRTRTVSSGGPRGGWRTETYWATVVHDRMAVAFAVEDGSGELEVDLEGGEVNMQSAAHTHSGVFNEPPPKLARLLRERYNTSTRGLLFNKTMRYVEVVIEEGDNLIVLGEVRSKKRDGRHIIGKGTDAPLIVSDKSDESLVKGYRWSRNLFAIGACVPILFFLPVLFIGLLFAGIGVFGMSQGAPLVPGGNNPGPGPGVNPGLNQGGNNPPQPRQPFIARTMDAAKAGGAGRNWTVGALARPPADPDDRKDYDAALADPNRKKEVAMFLAGLLDDKDVFTVSAAADALKVWVTPDAVPDMVAKADGVHFGAKANLMQALAASKDRKAVPALIKGLQPGHGAREAAAGLEAIGAEATPELVKALEDPKANRMSVCQVLGKVGTAEAIPALQKLAKERDRRLQLAAKDAIKKIEERK